MKRVFVTPLILIILFTLAFQGFAKDRKIHKFEDNNWNTKGEPCNICHDILDREGEEPPPGPQSQFTLYNSPTLDALVGQPDGVSKFCLGCHDGIIAEDKGGKTAYIRANAPVIGTDLSDDHPISFVYDEDLAVIDGKLYDPSTALSGLGDTIQKDLLRDNKVQCVSCHDAHGLTDQKALLVKSNFFSSLCFTCHNK